MIKINPMKQTKKNTKILIIKYLGILLFASFLISACQPKTQGEVESSPTSITTPSPAEDTTVEMQHIVTLRNESDFLQSMIPHHQEAIDSSKIITSQPNIDPKLKTFAEQVIAVQTSEIAQMQTWLKEWYQQESSGTEYSPMMGDLSTLQGNELELAYIKGMIFHHQGAIEMAKQVQLLQPRPQVQELANGIIASQSKEVAQLEAWLKEKYAQDVSSMPMDQGDAAH